MLTKEQRKAVESGKDRIIVSASAGSGKTSTMVERVIRLIERGTEISHIVMLTYTESAANEMISRLSDALIERIREADVMTREKLVAALDALPTLTCGTIHSYCYRLILSHFELVGLSPAYSILDKNASDAMKKRAFTALVRRMAAEDSEKYVAFAGQFDNKEDTGLYANMLKVYEHVATKGDREETLRILREIASTPLEGTAAAQYLIAYYDHCADLIAEALEALAEEAAACGADEIETYVRTIESNATSALRCDTLEDCYREPTHTKAPTVRKETRSLYLTLWDKVTVYKKEIDDLIKNRKLKLEGFRDVACAKKTYAAASETVLALLDFTESFTAEYERMKEEAKVLDFSDLEKYALKLLEREEVRSSLVAQYVLVDECQDVNPIQSKIIEHLSSGHGLFYVGDVKQSIFRFRLADPDIFLGLMEESIADPDHKDFIPFDRNFRSSDAVIDFVNAVFAPLMTKRFGGVDYPPLIGRDENPADGSVRCFFYSQEKEPVEINSVYSVRDTVLSETERSFSEEALWVRDRIREVVGTTLYDTKKKRSFVVRYSDIAVLARQRSDLTREVIECLRAAHIPMNLGKFGERECSLEGKQLAAFLRLLLSPHDDYALLTVMRSPMFEFSIDEMARISLLEGKSFYEKAAAYAVTEEGGRMAELFRYLEKARFDSSVFTFPDFLRHVIEERFRMPLLKETDGRLRLGKLLAFAETISGNRDVTSVSEFIEYYDKYYQGEVGGDVRDADAVNFMTIHSSKGLEFPVVFLVDAGRSIVSSAETRDSVLVDKDLGAQKKSVTDQEDVILNNLAFYAADLKRKQEGREDALRLLYVALTRARNSLYISGCVDRTRYANVISPEFAKSFAEMISISAKDRPGVDRYYVPAESAQVAPVSQAKGRTFDASKLREAFSYEYPHKKATVTGIKYTVTGINTMDDEGYSPPTHLFPEDRIAKGTAFHAVMEHIPFTADSEEEIAAFMDGLVSEGVIEGADRDTLRAGVVLDAVRKMRALVGERRTEREKTFMLKVPARTVGVADIDDEIAVQGKLDLLALGDDAVVVDYKASGAPDEVLLERYRAQLELYVLAVRKSYGIENVSAYIFVLGRNRLIRV